MLHNDFRIFTRHLQTSYSINNYYNGRTKRKQQWKHKSYYRKTIPQKKENAGRYMFPLKTICCFCRRLLEPEWNTVIANWRRSTVQSISINTIFLYQNSVGFIPTRKVTKSLLPTGQHLRGAWCFLNEYTASLPSMSAKPQDDYQER